MDSPGGAQSGSGGGVGDWAMPLLAFAAGFASPERSAPVFQNMRFMMEEQRRRQERGEDVEFRNRQFAAQEAERADVGRTRAQQRETAAVQLARERAQQQAGQLLPQLQFSRELAVGQPEIPAEIRDVGSELGADITPRVPGNQVRASVPNTIEDMRNQIFERFKDVSPDVRAELFNQVKGFGVPLAQQPEPAEIQRARHAIAAEQFLAPTTGAIPARRMSELIRSGAAQLPPDVLTKAINGDIRTVDTGQYIQFIDLTTKRIVATVQKTPEAKTQVIDDPSTGRKSILFINPMTREVVNLATDIPSNQPVDANTARFLAARSQGAAAPNMPEWIAALPPETALGVLKSLGIGAGGGNFVDQFLAEQLRGKTGPGGTIVPPKGAAPIPAPPGPGAAGAQIPVVAPDGTPGMWDTSKGPLPPGFKRR